MSNVSSSSSSLLDLNDDVLDLVCQALVAVEPPPEDTRLWASQPWIHPLVALSMTCKRVRHLAGRYIFNGIDLDAEQCSWNFIVETIALMRQGPTLKQHIGRLMLDRSYACHEEYIMEHSFFVDFVDLVESMPRLKMLAIYAPYDYIEEQEGLPDLELMEYVLKGVKSEARFSQIETLSISSSMPWLISKCPNLKRLEVEVHIAEQTPIAAISSASQLTHLRMKTWWSPELLEDLYYAAPNLVCLSMNRRNEPEMGPSIYELIDTLARFAQLRRLILPESHLLNVGLKSPWNGIDARLQKAQADLRVAKAVFGKCTGLRELWLGAKNKGTCIRTEDRFVEKISWNREKVVHWKDDV